MRNLLTTKNQLDGLKAFKPILAACHQGQRRNGVDDGAKFVYDHCFSHICSNAPHVIKNIQFESQYGYQKLYG